MNPELEKKVAALVLRRSALTQEEEKLFHAVFPSLVSAHFTRVLTVLRKRGVPENLIPDVRQNVLDCFFRTTCKKGFPDNIPKRLDDIAVSKASNARRRKKHAPMSVPLPSSRSEVPRSGPDLDLKIDLPEMWARLLPMLPPGQQAAIQAVFFDEMSYEDAADALGISVNTLAARLATGKRVLAGMVQAFLSEKPRR